MAEMPDENKPTGLPEGVNWGDIPPGLEEAFANMDSEAVPLHEIYNSNCRAGFDSQQALYLLGVVLTGSPGTAPRGSEPQD